MKEEMNQDTMDLSSYSIRTDLAREAHAMALENRPNQSNIPGVHIKEWEEDGILTSWIEVEDSNAAKELGKLPGRYLTLEIPALRSLDSNLEKRVSQHFAEQFSQFLEEVGIGSNDKALLVGLGNWDVTPDAIGPEVIKHTMVTRHLFELAPDHVQDGYRSVSAISPGVLGITGIETSEIVYGVVEKSKPDFVIAFDALASRALSRVNTTIQVADIGINPGSGVGNKRKPLNKETLGIPVIAIGIPTVVEAATIAHDTIDFVLKYISREMQGIKGNPLDPHNQPSVQQLNSLDVSNETKNRMMGMVGTLEPEEKRQLIREVLMPLGQNLVVTPKEVDAFVDNIAKTIANGMNCALHEAVTMDNVASHVK
ncbi:GPR endopeptidase [Risungbinella massiliensis]|uniref:GPR endopeptidase n=1 Tax=Risungbinella massiliensis TaxID=1329796 RepID=UPI000B19EBBF